MCFGGVPGTLPYSAPGDDVTVIFDGVLFADYHQFYLVDAAQTDDVPVQWTDEDVRARILVGPHAVIFSTERNMSVPVQVHLHETEPELDLTSVDHAVSGRFESLGEVVIAGLTDYLPDAARLTVPAGPLCAMAVSTGLGTLSEDGTVGDDAYVVHLWHCPAPMPVRVLEQWNGD